MEIWVQVNDLKVGFMSKRDLKISVDYIGKFVASCPKNFNGIWRDYLRVRMSIDIDKSLERNI